MIEEVLGRVRNYVRMPDGRRNWPGGLARIRTIEGILQAQFVQTSLETIEVRTVLSRPLTEEESTQTAIYVQEALQYPFKITLRTVEEIERGPSGKFEEFLSLLED